MPDPRREPRRLYAAQQRAASARARRDEQLRVEVKSIHEAGRRTYGSPRVHTELRARGERCGRKRVARLLREAGLRVKVGRRRRPQTTAVQEAACLDRVWAGDITYVPTREGWLYLAVILDLASRRVVGWSMKPALDRSLAIDALRMALAGRCFGPKGLLHHSDRGSQYAALEYQELLARHQMVPSMSRQGNCYVEYLEVWYNRQRRHSSLDYLSPAEYEHELMSKVV